MNIPLRSSIHKLKQTADGRAEISKHRELANTKKSPAKCANKKVQTASICSRPEFARKSTETIEQFRCEAHADPGCYTPTCTIDGNCIKQKRIQVRSGNVPILTEHYRAFFEFAFSIHPKSKLQFRGCMTINPAQDDDQSARRAIKQKVDNLKKRCRRNKVQIQIAGVLEKTETATLHAHLLVLLPPNCEWLLEDLIDYPVIHVDLIEDKSRLFRILLYILKQRKRYVGGPEDSITGSISRIAYKALGPKLYQNALNQMAEKSAQPPTSHLTSLRYEQTLPFNGERYLFTRSARRDFNVHLKRSMERQNRNRTIDDKKPKHPAKRIRRLATASIHEQRSKLISSDFEQKASSCLSEGSFETRACFGNKAGPEASNCPF